MCSLFLLWFYYQVLIASFVLFTHIFLGCCAGIVRASEVILKDVGKINQSQTTTKH